VSAIGSNWNLLARSGDSRTGNYSHVDVAENNDSSVDLLRQLPQPRLGGLNVIYFFHPLEGSVAVSFQGNQERNRCEGL
jgi:hypothetical protein